MNITLKQPRVDKLLNYLSTLKINSKKYEQLIIEKDIQLLTIFDEAFTHSSANKNFNHEKLEFFGDAVLRLSAWFDGMELDKYTQAIVQHCTLLQ